MGDAEAEPNKWRTKKVPTDATELDQGIGKAKSPLRPILANPPPKKKKKTKKNQKKLSKIAKI